MNCTICNKELDSLVCSNEYCREIHAKCCKCKKIINESNSYEYRGVISCADCIEEAKSDRDRERREIIAEEDAKDWSFLEFDLSKDNPFGRANLKTFARKMEVASKSSLRRKIYEEQQQP